MVDFVRAYFEPGAQLYMGLDECVRVAGRVLARGRQASLPIIHTRVVFTPGGADGGYFYQKVGALELFAGDGPLGEIMPEVAPQVLEPVVIKQYASAFFGTSLASTLHAAGVDTVIIMGVSTSGCIRATAVDAIQHGFIPIVVREGVGDRSDGPHASSLFDIQAKYGEVLSEADVNDYLASLPVDRPS
ncbi:MAG: isochorismatase family protein [Salinibacterium sp.]|nr:isochorismatase family protein [Salinibacterium sp.]